MCGFHIRNSCLYAYARLFSFGGRIARVNESDARIEVLDAMSARYELAQVVDWIVSRNGGGTPVNPDITMIQYALVTPKPPLPRLTQVVSIPVITASGRLVMEPGLDRESGIFYAPGLHCLPRINPDATKVDAIASVQWIQEEVLCDFPFENDASRAAAISLAILPFARELVSGPTPFYLLDKPNAGTGATTLARALTYPFIGSEIAVKSWTSSEDERRKQITAHLNSGGGPYFFDNLGGFIDSNVLASVLTSTMWSDRLLQTSQNVDMPNRSTRIGTGNNPRFHEQILRHIARIRLVTLVENPSERTDWRHSDLLAWIADHRTEYVQHILTILIAWINEGKPMFSGKPLNSYESWSNVLGGILEFIEVPGFLKNLKELRATLDSESEMTRECIEVWWKNHGGDTKTASNITTDFPTMEIAGIWDAPTLQGSITKAGTWLSTLVDRVYEIDGTKVVVTRLRRSYSLREVKEKAA